MKGKLFAAVIGIIMVMHVSGVMGQEDLAQGPLCIRGPPAHPCGPILIFPWRHDRFGGCGDGHVCLCDVASTAQIHGMSLSCLDVDGHHAAGGRRGSGTLYVDLCG